MFITSPLKVNTGLTTSFSKNCNFSFHAYDGLTNICNATHIFLDTEELYVFLKLYLLLYADDTVILAESRIELQSAIYYTVRCTFFQIKYHFIKL
jgi:hypothetical protein